MEKTHYEILEISHQATASQIKVSYRKLAKKYHPDLNPNDKKAETLFKAIGEAYEVLSDAEKRKKYDFELQNIDKKGMKKAQKSSEAKNSPADFDIRNFGAGFESFFGFDPKTKQPTGKKFSEKSEKTTINTDKAFESFFGFKGK